MSSRSADWVRDGCRRSRGDGGGYLWFSAKLCRWAAIWLGLLMLDDELFLSIGDDAAPSEPGEATAGFDAFPAPFAAESPAVSIAKLVGTNA